MQLNFLQEDLLEILQKAKADTPVAAAPLRTTKPAAPEQMPLIDEAVYAPVPARKAEMKRTPVIETVLEEIHEKSAEEKSARAFKTISEAAEILGVPAYVLRFWESQFPQISPTKSRGGRRYYRPEDMVVLEQVKHLLYKEGYTIKGARKAFAHAKQEGILAVHPVAVQAPSKKPLITPKQKAQLSTIRSELIGLKEQLAPYIA